MAAILIARMGMAAVSSGRSRRNRNSALPRRQSGILDWLRPTIRGLCLPIRVCPLGDDDCLDPPHRELKSVRKNIPGVLRPIPVNDEEVLLVFRPALKLAL